MSLFHDMMHKKIEVYVDDIFVKSKKEEDHHLHLKKLFERFRKYNLKLNPAKCAFLVKSGKLLAFLFKIPTFDQFGFLWQTSRKFELV